MGSDFEDMGGRGEGDFIEPIVATDDEGALGAKGLEGFGELALEGGFANAEQLQRGGGRVAEWTEVVEEGWHVDGAADIGNVFHGWVKEWGVAEADAEIGEALFDDGSWRIDFDSEFGQDIGGAGGASDGSISMFGDGETAGGDEDGGGGRDIESLESITTGSAGIDELGVR